jgi:hypothetical protein
MQTIVHTTQHIVFLFTYTILHVKIIIDSGINHSVFFSALLRYPQMTVSRSFILIGRLLSHITSEEVIVGIYIYLIFIL